MNRSSALTLRAASGTAAVVVLSAAVHALAFPPHGYASLAFVAVASSSSAGCGRAPRRWRGICGAARRSGVSATGSPTRMIQVVDLGGVYLLSFLAILVNASIAEILLGDGNRLRLAPRVLVTPALVLVAAAAYGA